MKKLRELTIGEQGAREHLAALAKPKRLHWRKCAPQSWGDLQMQPPLNHCQFPMRYQGAWLQMGKGSKFRKEEKGVFCKLSPSEKFYEYFGDAAKTWKLV